MKNIQLVLRIALIVFLVEGMIMLGLSVFGPIFSPVLEAIIDATVLVMIISPIMSFWVIKPYIKARDHAEQELVQMGRQNKLLLNTAAEGIFGVDIHGCTTFINSTGARMIGHKPEDLIGRAQHEIFHHTKQDGCPYPIEECPICTTYHEESIYNSENEIFWRKDGTSFQVDFISTPILDEGETIGTVVNFRDITERKLLEAELGQAQKLEAVGQLAAGIAHEINTPTQFVNDNTRFLQDAFADYGRLFTAYDQLTDAAASGTVPDELVTEVKELVEEVDVDYLKEEIPQAIEQSLEGLGRIAKIVLAMKEFSHPGTDEKTPTDLNRAIETTINVSRNEWKYSAELITELDPELPQVPLLAGGFNQVMLNLIVNAAHAITDVVGKSGKMGEIRIATRQDGEWVEIRVSDTGKGIPKAFIKRIFDPFFTTKEVGKGSGQGLAIAWSVIVDKHGGTIDVESGKGKGTTFTIRLPITEGTIS